jgi:hypothetical protein
MSKAALKGLNLQKSLQKRTAKTTNTAKLFTINPQPK